MTFEDFYNVYYGKTVGGSICKTKTNKNIMVNLIKTILSDIISTPNKLISSVDLYTDLKIKYSIIFTATSRPYKDVFNKTDTEINTFIENPDLKKLLSEIEKE
jgi:hypothetical protein